MKLERITPVSAGIPPRAIINLMNRIREEKHQLHNLMLLKGGKVIFERSWEPYGPSYRHQLFSLSKSFASTAVGFAVQEGLLTVNTKIGDIFTDEFEKLGIKMDDEVRDITVKNLLTMSTGMEYEAWDETDDIGNVLSFLSGHIKNAPGETFRYSSISTFMCSAAVTRLTGMSVAEYLKPRLFDPLGIENYFWSKEIKSGINMGGFGLYITVEDIATFGQFILQKGAWNGKQLLNAEWIGEATSKQIENGQKYDSDWGSGYGYQFWRCVPEGVFRGDGAFGQYCVVMPRQDMVLAVNSNVDMQKLLYAVWKMLDDIRELPVSEADTAELDGIKDLSYLTAAKPGDAYPKLRAMYETDMEHFYIYFDFNEKDGVVALHTDKDKSPYGTFFFERGAWTKGAAPYSPTLDMMSRLTLSRRSIAISYDHHNRVITHGSWEGRVFHGVTWFYETPGRNEFRCTFNEDFSEVTVEQRGGTYNTPFKEAYKGKRVKEC